MGKGYRVPGSQERQHKHSLNLKKLEALLRLRDTARPVLPTKFSGGSAGSSSGGTGNFLPVSGGSMIGNIAFDPKLISTETDGNRINLEPDNSNPKNSTYIFVTAIGTPPFNIKFIDGAERSGQYLIYQGTNQQVQNLLNANLLTFTNIVGDGVTTVTVLLGDTGTLSDGDSINVIGTTNFDLSGAIIADLVVNTSFTYELSILASTIPETLGQIQDGNIITADGNTLVLDGTISTLNVPVATLIFDVTINAWRVVSTSESGGGGGISFPIDFPEEPARGTVVTDQVIDFASSNRHSISMIVGVATISLDIQNEPTDKLALSSITISQDNVGGRTFTFLDTVINSQTIIDAFDALGVDESISFMLEWERGVFTVYLKTGNIVSGGGGSLSEPIELGFNEAVTQTPPTLTTIAGDIFNPTHVTLDQDIELDLVISATASKYKSIFIIFDTLGSGFTVTWPVSVVNPPVINDSVAQRISVILYTIDNGTLWTHATSVGSSSGAEFFGPWTANHDAAGFSLTGLDTLDFFQAGQSIQNKADADGGILYTVNDLQSHIFRSLTDEIARFEEAAANVFRLNMLDHRIINAQDIAFDVAAVFAGSGATPTIGYEASTSRLLVNLPTGGNLFVTNNNAVVATQMNNGSVTSNIINANDVLQLGVDVTVPTVAGEFRSDGTDVRVFSGGVVRNLSDVGAQSSIVDGNTSATVLDAAPSFSVVLNGIQKYSISNTRVDYADLDLFGINQINMTDPSSNDISTLTASASGLLLNIISTSDAYDIKFNSADAFHVDDIRTRVLSTTPNISGAVLSLFRDDASPVNADDLGLIKFDGRDSIGTFTTYAELSATIENIANGSESANFIMNLKQNGFDVDMFRLVNGSMILRTFDPGPGVGANYTLLKEDPSPGPGELIGNVNWNVLDSPTETTYARIQVFIQEATDAALFKIQVRADNTLQDALLIEGNDNSTQFQFLTSSNGNTRMQPLGSARMGYFVTPQATDFLTNIGTAGTLQIPQISDGNPSLNDLNQAGGAFDGAIVHDINDGNLYIRNNSGAWDFYTRDGQIT